MAYYHCTISLLFESALESLQSYSSEGISTSLDEKERSPAELSSWLQFKSGTCRETWMRTKKIAGMCSSNKVSN